MEKNGNKLLLVYLTLLPGVRGLSLAKPDCFVVLYSKERHNFSHVLKSEEQQSCAKCYPVLSLLSSALQES